MVVYSQVLLACVAVLLFPGQAAQPLFAVLVMAVYAVGTIKLQPYLLNSDDIAASFANVGLWLTSLYSLLSQTNVRKDRTAAVHGVSNIPLHAPVQRRLHHHECRP